VQTLHAETEIDAAPGRVWEIVSDLARYESWNPFIVRASGGLQPGARLDITIQAPGLRAVRFHPRVLDVEPGRLLRWKGQWAVPGLFDGRHSLIVEPLGDDRSRFTTHEEVTGLLLPFLGKAMAASQEGFERFCRALKQRAEEAERGADAGTA